MDEESASTSGSEGNENISVKYFQHSKKSPIVQDYDIKDRLGDGGFSIVKKGVRRSDGAQVAIKIIKKRKVGPEDIEREVNIWKLASETSKRVVHLYDIYEDPKTVYLVMELMSGGELFEKIVDMEDYSEKFAATIIKQVLLIIRDLHRVHIVHQDLKPENLLLVSKDSNAIKLCDFGLAEIAEDDVELVGIVGSTTYMAPEVVAETGHSKPVDVYAAGVIMYILLCGYPPFEPENGIVELEFPEPEWDEISEAAKDLITVLLSHIPEQRPTPDEALKHNWFIDVETIREPKPLYGTLRTLKKFRERKGDPVGSMRECRGRNEGGRTTVFGVFGVSPQPAQPEVSAAKEIEVPVTTVEPVKQSLPKDNSINNNNENDTAATAANLEPSERQKLLAALMRVDSKTKSMESLLSNSKTKGKSTTKPPKKPEPPPLNSAVEELFTKIKKDLQAHQSTTDILRKQLVHLKMDIAAEAVKRESTERKLNWEISLLKKNVEEERKKQKKISQILSKQKIKL